MVTSNGKTSLSREVDISFRQRYKKQMEFWIENGEFFSALVGEIPMSRWNELKDEFHNQVEFYEKYIPEADH